MPDVRVQWKVALTEGGPTVLSGATRPGAPNAAGVATWRVPVVTLPPAIPPGTAWWLARRSVDADDPATADGQWVWTPQFLTALAAADPATTRDVGPAYLVLEARTATEMAAARENGATHALVQAFWDAQQSAAGGAVNAKATADQIAAARAAGLRVVLEVALQYPPAFVKTGTPKFRDQAGVDWDAGQGSGDQIRDWVWSAAGRGYVSDYLDRLFAQLPWADIARVRVGGLQKGELQFPGLGKDPQWWAFSDAAQGKAPLAAGMYPAPRPGYSPSAAPAWSVDDETFYSWYAASMNSWMLWLIAKHREHHAGPIWVMHPGAGLRPVSQTPTSMEQGKNYRINASKGLDWDAQIAAYPDPNVYAYSTWADATHFWPPDWASEVNDGNAAPWYHLVRTARRYGRGEHLWGENTGGQTTADMARVFSADGATGHGYDGFAWLSHGSLTAGGSGASYADWRRSIQKAALGSSAVPYWRGVNAAGAEFTHTAAGLPGRYGYEYRFNPRSHFELLRSRGHRVARIPFRWERVQHALGGDLDPTGLAELRAGLMWAADAGVWTIPDLHNYGRFITEADEELTLGAGVTLEHFADVWSKLAKALADVPGIAGWGLMNEPHDLPDNPNYFAADRTLYDFKTDVQGWALAGTGGSVARGTYPAGAGADGSLDVSKVLPTGTGYQTMRVQVDARAVSYDAGSVLAFEVFVPSSSPGTWRVRPGLQNSSFTEAVGVHTTLAKGATTRVTYDVPAGLEGTNHRFLILQLEVLNGDGTTPSAAQIGSVTHGKPSGTRSTWKAASQAAVKAIRDAGDLKDVYVAGDAYSGAQKWETKNGAPWITDPAGGRRVVYEAHYYYSAGYNVASFASLGSYDALVADAKSRGWASLEARVREEVGDFTGWLTKYGARGLVGEIGWPARVADEAQYAAIGELIYGLLDAAKVGATVWTTGIKWSPGETTNVYPDGVPAAQAVVIEAPAHLTPTPTT